MRNSAEEILHFERSIIWLDIVDELNIWLDEIRTNLESEDVSIDAVPALRGSAKAIRNVINMLPNLAELANINDELEEEEN